MTVTSNSGVAAAWKNQEQEEARSHNGNFWFRGRTIYSYATEMGTIVKLEGMSIAFINRESYSTTTSGKHQSRLYSVGTSLTLPVYHTDASRAHQLIKGIAFSDDCLKTMRKHLTELIASYAEQAELSRQKAKRARTYKDMHLRTAEQFNGYATQVMALMGLRPENFQAWVVANGYA